MVELLPQIAQVIAVIAAVAGMLSRQSERQEKRHQAYERNLGALRVEVAALRGELRGAKLIGGDA